MRISSAFILAAALIATPALAKLPVKTVKFDAKTKDYEIGVAYPQTGNKAVDAEIASWVKRQVAEFKGEADGADVPDGGPAGYSLDISFEVPRNDDKIFAVVFTDSTFEGGAHPNSFFETMNFQMPDGWRLYLPEIFTTAGLKKISALAIADLDKQLLTPDSPTDKDWIARGAGPDWDNFANFVLLPNMLDIQYASYNVAAYAAGPQETKIPLAALKDFYRPDWHAPAASFDCTAAHSSIEKAICSDVALARLDREVTTAYRVQDVKDDASKKTTNPLREAQRAWVALRNKSCGTQSGPAAVACLTPLYRARLKAINGPQ